MKIIIRNASKTNITNSSDGESAVKVRNNNSLTKTRDKRVAEQYRNSRNKTNLISILKEYSKSR